MWQSQTFFKPEEQVGGPPVKWNRLSACMWQSQKCFKPEEQVGGPPVKWNRLSAWMRVGRFCLYRGSRRVNTQ
ncbi:hypothetical protein GDO81_009292 [Engystomops pustulosus]|uniref:Uncharacterized protein n=1 Tax=Engystomops pustulosus TaxID=76066 RepID=A0AAV7BPT3_ENGPU|nr:hypothetical protein GDO81_009292 [Engystomops pustulosus]